MSGLALRRLEGEPWRALAGAEAGSAEAGLVCEDGSAAYPVRGGIPVLLKEERLELEGQRAEGARSLLRVVSSGNSGGGGEAGAVEAGVPPKDVQSN